MLKIKMRVIYLLSLVILTTCEDEPLSKQPHSKRILLNDPDVVGQRLLHIETLLRDLQAKYSHQEGVITSLQHELADEKLKHEQSLQSYAAGEKYSYSGYKGGASNMLCLPDDPELSNKTASTNSQIFGTEFENNDLVAGAYNEDVACALCRSTNTSSTVMFPGRKTCYAGWKEEYNGVLASSAYSHNPSPYICVDTHPIYVNGGQRSNDEHYLYVTNLKCGSIQCPPYTDNVQVYCVVCSK